jgi:hypothetical protein
VKRALPTARGRTSSRAPQRSVPPSAERSSLAQPVIALAQATLGSAAAELAVELVRALVAEGVAVSALVTTDDPSADAQRVLSQLHDAGARDTAWVRLSHAADKVELERALERFAKDQWLVVVGNTLPLYFRSELCVLVTAPHATHLSDAQRIAQYAHLQASAPTPKLAHELAKLIRAKGLVRVPVNG